MVALATVEPAETSLQTILSQLRSLDLESHKTQPGLGAPPIVVGSTTKLANGTERLLTPDGVLAAFRYIAEHTDDILVGTHICYDLGLIAAADPTILPLIFKMFDERRVYDILLGQALDAIAGGHLFRTPDGQPLANPTTGKQTNRYSLELCVQLVLNRIDAKANDFWRQRYAILQRVPWSQWPSDALQYLFDDVRNPIEVAATQLYRGFRNVGDMPSQVETAFDLHLGGAIWGLRTDRARTEMLAHRAELAHQAAIARFGEAGFLRPDGTEDTVAVKTAVARAYGATGRCSACGGWGRVRSQKGTGSTVICKANLHSESSPRGCDGTGLDFSSSPAIAALATEGGGLSASKDTLLESGDELLAEYADNPSNKIRQTYVPFLRQGYDKPICLSPNVLVASGRTSYEDPSQTFPQKFGVRECIRARDGYWLFSVDYAAIELCTLAQICYWLFGHSNMRDIINATGDPGGLHTELAGEITGRSFEEMKSLLKSSNEQEKKAAKDARNGVKAWNFGAPGKMGAAKMVLNQRAVNKGSTTAPNGRVYNGVRFCLVLGGEQACGLEKVLEWKGRPTPPICKRCVEICEYVIKPAWFRKFPEIKEYFDWVKYHVDTTGEIACFGPVDRIRGGLTMPEGCNNGFQALNADGGKYALRVITRECYTNPSSPLWGTRPILFPHDEIFGETPRERANVAVPTLAKRMEECMNVYVPDVKVKTEYAIMEYWYKDAEEVRDANGILQPWYPTEKAA